VNITLSADPDLIDRARTWAQEHGTSLNALIRDDLERLVGSGDRRARAEGFRETALSSPGRSQGGRPFKRDELYTGKRFS
jgi:hypothetical protein